MDVGKAVLPALVTEGESGVVDAAQMQDGRLHIVHVHGFLGNVPAEVICGAVHNSGLHAAAGEPPAVRFAKMIASFGIGRIALTERSLLEAAELANLATKTLITRFLPYSTKGRLPTAPILVRAYLAFRPAWWLMGKQTLYVGEHLR